MFVYICVVLFAIITRCQNTASYANSSESKGNTTNRDSSHVCTGDDCQHLGVIIGSVIGAHILLIVVIIGLVCCCKHCRRKPFRSNSRFVFEKLVKDTDLEMHDFPVFQSGLWTVRYHQNKKWYGPNPVSLSFDVSLSKITGTGTDNSGNYTLDGSFSVKTRRISLTKTYESNTHNETVTIKLTWNAKSMQFEGKWYDETLKLFGENKFESKFVGMQQSITNEECNNA